jgi:eukaryotic-like serine/threonine-protein kinase
MAVTPGTRLGPYEIQSPLGAGGMGEVYRALDTRLDRIVAVKILPSHLSEDPEAKERFDREARTISSLNHPNICTLYDVGHQNGVDYLVLEYLEGETLATYLDKGALSSDQVVRYGIEICEGLEIAHRTGVVHRDLKPGNIMLTKTGVKLMDFGLAKSLPASASANPSLTLTLSGPAANSPLTEKGMIVGTFQYMSPEQVQGKEVDGRSDIFSLGAVLYEMVTGKRAFEGKSQLSVAAAILENEPAPIVSVKPMTSPLLDHAIVSCLAKNPEDRWQTARDLALELKWSAGSGAGTGMLTPPNQRRSGRQWLAWSVAALLGVTVVLTTFLYRGRRPPVTTPVRFDIRLPAGTLNFTLSPDGRQLAFLAPDTGGRNLVWIRALDSLEPHPLPGTENVQGPPVFWSPDSRFIAFQLGGKLKKIDISGGPPQDICDASVVIIGGAWNHDGTIIFGTVGNGVMQVPAAGGVPALLTTTEGRNEVHVFPSFLQDGRHFFYLRGSDNPGIYLGSIDVKPEQQSSRRILPTSLMAVYAASADPSRGHLLFLREGSLLAQVFDEKNLKLQGDPIPVAERVGSLFLSGQFSVSPSGVLAFRGGKTALWLSRFIWFDRQGKQLGNTGEPETYSYTDLALSPDGTRLAATRIDPKVAGGEGGIWLLDLIRGVSTRFTFDISPDSAPVWSPDGRRVAFAAFRGGNGIYQKATNGSGSEQELVRATGDQFPDDWSRDGRFLLYTHVDPRTHADLWVLPLAGDGTPSGTATPFANTEFSEEQGRFSPDARWVAYASDESGRSEIYIQPFPAPPNGGSKMPISRDGGSEPRWRRDGKELFYFSPDGKLMAADVTEGTTFKASVPRILFQVPVAQIAHNAVSTQVFGWDVAPDGKRFLIDTATTSTEPVTVVLHWTSERKME